MSDSNRENGPPESDRSDPTAPAPYPEQYPAPPPSAGQDQPDGTPPSTGSPYGTPPPPPASPYPAPGQDTAAPAAPPPYGSSPYGAPSGDNPYGTPPAYGTAQAPYGTPPPAYYQSAPSQSNTSALVLTIVSAIGTLSCCLPLPALILGIIALTKQSTDPQQSAKLAKYGWITFGAMVVLAVFAFVAIIAFGLITAPVTTTDF